MPEAFHYSSDLLSLLIETIPKLCKSKRDVVLYFQSAGVHPRYFGDLEQRVQANPDRISKFEITRVVLTRLNQGGDATLRDRREIIKRVTETVDFSSCWPGDEREAKGLVADVQKLVNVRDTFTRIKQEHERSRSNQRLERQQELERIQEQREEIDKIKYDLYRLFQEMNPQARGRALESVLARLFAAHGMHVRDAFTLASPVTGKVGEQIDGVIEFDNHVYLVEAKWTKSPMGREDLSSHLSRIMYRAEARALIISAAGFTEPAIECCRDALQHKVVVLIGLDEVVQLLDQRQELGSVLRAKVHAAMINRLPLYRIQAAP